jgi:hypothetical protein
VPLRSAQFRSSQSTRRGQEGGSAVHSCIPTKAFRRSSGVSRLWKAIANVSPSRNGPGWRRASVAAREWAAFNDGSRGEGLSRSVVTHAAHNTSFTLSRRFAPLATAGKVVGLWEGRWTPLRRPCGRLSGRRETMNVIRHKNHGCERHQRVSGASNQQAESNHRRAHLAARHRARCYAQLVILFGAAHELRRREGLSGGRQALVHSGDQRSISICRIQRDKTDHQEWPSRKQFCGHRRSFESTHHGTARHLIPGSAWALSACLEASTCRKRSSQRHQPHQDCAKQPSGCFKDGPFKRHSSQRPRPRRIARSPLSSCFNGGLSKSIRRQQIVGAGECRAHRRLYGKLDCAFERENGLRSTRQIGWLRSLRIRRDSCGA